ncbi:MAG: hypothetical protein V7K36_09580 [Nostoc sp.]
MRSPTAGGYAIASFNPVRSGGCSLLECSAPAKGSKMRSSRPGAMPIPVSLTVIAH